jgi:multidrug efflux pump subunit AcrA (membrane-fusion protein)
MDDNRKKLIIKISGVIVGMLLILTFFSNTIYSLGIAGVVVGQTHSGVISTTHRAEGVLDFADNMGIYAEYSGRIFLVAREGDRVYAGDTLFYIHADVEDMLERLLQDNNRLARVQLSVDRDEAELALAQGLLAALTPAPFVPREVAPLDLSLFDQNHVRLEAEIERAEAHYHAQQTLFAAGAISRALLDDARSRLHALQADMAKNDHQRAISIYDHQRNAERAEDENRIALEHQARAYENERNALNQRITNLQHSLAALALEETEIRRQIAEHQDSLNAGGISTAYAPYDGVMRAAPNAPTHNSFVDRGRPVMGLGILTQEQNQVPYMVTAYFPETMDISPATEVARRIRLNIPSHDEHGLIGRIERIAASAGRLRAEISFATSMPVLGGERVEVYIEELFAPSAAAAADGPPLLVLPSHAIREDALGNFILYTERVSNTLLGHSYYVRRASIVIDHIGDRYTAFSAIDDIEGPIILQSDRPIAVDDRVRPIGER